MAPISYATIHQTSPLNLNRIDPRSRFMPPVVRRLAEPLNHEDPTTNTPVWAIVVGIFVLPLGCFLIWGVFPLMCLLLKSHREKTTRAKHGLRTMTTDMDRIDGWMFGTDDIRAQRPAHQSGPSQPAASIFQRQRTFPTVSRPVVPQCRRRNTLPGEWISDTASLRSDIPPYAPVWKLTAANLKKLRILHASRPTQYRQSWNSDGAGDGEPSVPGAWIQAPPPVYTRQ